MSKGIPRWGDLLSMCIKKDWNEGRDGSKEGVCEHLVYNEFILLRRKAGVLIIM